MLAAHDGSAFEESYNLLNAWLSIVPGNGAYNLRRLALLETNLADLSFLFTLDPGEPVSRAPGPPALWPCSRRRRRRRTAYNLHVEDVGHTLVLGATGSGKSFLLNFLVTHLQQYDPLTVVLDLGHSYRKLATLLDGSYLELGLRQQGVTINPFDLSDPSPEQLHFLHAFTRVLLEGEDGYRLSDARGSRDVRGRREPVRPRPRPAAPVHAGQPAAAGARRAPAQVGRGRPVRGDVRQPARHADDGPPAGLRLRVDAGVSRRCSSRCCSTCCIA